MNIEEVLDYAHARGIRVILGFHWGWGHKGSIDLSCAEDRRRIKEKVLETYRAQYAHLKHDGIYFQTLTEHKDLELAGKSTAAWACDLVNETADALLADFENHSAFILGEQNTLHSRERLALRQNEWDRINAHWFENYPLAARFYREILAVNPNLTATGLVEDGVFEDVIQPSVALFAEMLWNPAQSDAQILGRAMRAYYSRIPA